MSLQDQFDLESTFFADSTVSDQWRVEKDGDDFLLQINNSTTSNGIRDDLQSQPSRHTAPKIQLEQLKEQELGNQLLTMSGLDWWMNHVFPFFQDTVKETFFRSCITLISDARKLLDNTNDDSELLTTLFELRQCLETKRPVFVEWTPDDQLKLDTLHKHIEWLRYQSGQVLLAESEAAKDSKHSSIQHMIQRINDLSRLGGMKNLVRVINLQCQQLIKYHDTETDQKLFRNDVLYIQNLKSAAENIIHIIRNEIDDWAMALEQTKQQIEKENKPDTGSMSGPVKQNLLKWISKLNSWIYLQDNRLSGWWLSITKSVFLNYGGQIESVEQLSLIQLKRTILLFGNHVDSLEQKLISGQSNSNSQMLVDTLRQYKNDLLEIAEQNQRLFWIENQWKNNRLLELQRRNEFFTKKLVSIQNEAIESFKDAMNVLNKTRVEHQIQLQEMKVAKTEESKRSMNLLHDYEKSIYSGFTDHQLQRNCLEILRCRDQVFKLVPMMEKNTMYNCLFLWISSNGQ
jgi:hypothetical protein